MPTRGAPGFFNDGTQIVQDWRRRLEIPELIHYIDAYETPFFTFAAKGPKGKASTPDYKFYTHEKRPIPDTDALTASPAPWDANDQTIFTVADTTFYYANATLRYTGSNNGQVRVISVDTSTTMTVEAAEATLPTMAVGGDLISFLAPSYLDGSNRGEVISKETERDYNVTQIMRLPVEVTYRMSTAPLHGAKKVDLMKRDILRLWKRYVERQYLLGVRYEDTSGAHELTVTEGVIPWLDRVSADGNTDVYIKTRGGGSDTLADYSWDDFVEDMEQCFLFKSSPTKTAFCSRLVIKRFAQLGFFSYDGSGANSVGRFALEPTKNQFGVAMWKLSTPFGSINIVETPAFAGDYAKYMLIADPMGFRTRYFEGWDVQWLPLDLNGTAATGEELYADMGIEMVAPELHSYVNWTA